MVKMRCVSTRGYFDLTEGRVYEGELKDNWFSFRDDAGDGRELPADLFEHVTEDQKNPEPVKPGWVRESIGVYRCDVSFLPAMRHGIRYNCWSTESPWYIEVEDDNGRSVSFLKRHFTQVGLPNVEPATPLIRTFETGATRNLDHNKIDYEGFLSPQALHAFGEYMHGKRIQADGTMRDSDNWAKGIPIDSYMKSMWRHLMDVWMIHRGLEPAQPETGKPVDKVEALCALLFNVQGMLHETLKEKDSE